MKFQWYIIGLGDGTIQGSNDVDEVKSFVEDENYRVLSGQHGIFFAGNTIQHEVQPLETDAEEDEDEDEDEDDDGSEDRVEPEEDESPEDKENESESPSDATKDWTD